MKTSIYIDGFNLFYGLLKGTSNKWLDIEKLCKRKLRPEDSIVKIKYFTAMISDTEQDPNLSTRQAAYIRAVKTLKNVEIILGHFSTHSKKRAIAGCSPPQMIRVNLTEEKRSDVNMASHIVLDGCQNQYDMAILVTNDSDLEEPVRIVTEILGKKIGIFNPHEPRHRSGSLGQYATFVKQLHESDARASQLPDKISDSHGKIRKPSNWNK